MNDIHDKFETYLNGVGSRYTIQKRLIVKEIGKMKQHFEVDNFVGKMKRKDANCSRATIYRTIKQLLEAKMLQRIQTKDGKVYYEQNYHKEHHAHLICNTCGKIDEISEETISVWIRNYCKLKNFDAAYQSLHIYGTCTHCQKEETT